MADSSIEWTDRVWNPTTGCDRVSPGCDHCYALTMAKRLKAMGQAKYQRDGNPLTSGPGFGLSVHEGALPLPLSWRKPARIFVNSMSDLFHDSVPDEFIAEVFAVMALARRHTFQLLTKRHARMRSLLSRPNFPRLVDNRVLKRHVYAAKPEWPLPNVWLGVSCENQQWANIRVTALLNTPAAVRWVSAEPLLGPINLAPFLKIWRPLPDVGYERLADLDGGLGEHERSLLDWVVTGGESGPNARPAAPDWFRQIRDQCVAAGVAYLHKQNGGRTPKSNGRELDGRVWDEYPAGVGVS